MLQPWMPGWDAVFSDEGVVLGATQHLQCCFSNLLCVFIKTGEVLRVLGSFPLIWILMNSLLSCVKVAVKT